MFLAVSCTMTAMSHAEKVGEWIATAADVKGLDGRALAALVGVDAKTVTNVTTGRTEIKQGSRARWEDALGWKHGSIAAGYKRGEPPETAESEVPVGSGVDPDALAEVAKQMQAATDAIVAMLKQTRPPAEGE